MNFQNFNQNRKRAKTERGSRFYTKFNIKTFDKKKNNETKNEKHFLLAQRSCVIERSILDKQSVSSNPPVSAFFVFFSAVVPVLLYCCCTIDIVHTWWFCGLLVDGCFCCVSCCFTAVLRTTVLLSTGWVDGSVRGCVHGFVGYFVLFCFFPRYIGPALA